MTNVRGSIERRNTIVTCKGNGAWCPSINIAISESPTGRSSAVLFYGIAIVRGVNLEKPRLYFHSSSYILNRTGIYRCLDSMKFFTLPSCTPHRLKRPRDDEPPHSDVTKWYSKAIYFISSYKPIIFFSFFFFFTAFSHTQGKNRG